MYARLAFAVAISVEPDILIVDEALSVGDEAFQRKCFARIQEIQQNGAAVLFVSHSAQSVVELCNAALLLDQGELIMSGKPKPVVAQYHKLIYAPEEKCAALREAIRMAAIPANIEEVSSGAATSIQAASKAYYDPALIPQSTVSYETQGALIENPHTTSLDGTPANVLTSGESYCFCYTVIFTEAVFNVRFGSLIKTTSGVELGGISSATRGMGESYIKAGAVVQVSFRFRCLLLPGVYFLNAGCGSIVNGEERFLHRVIDAAMFRVMPEEKDARTGIVDFEFSSMIEVGAYTGA